MSGLSKKRVVDTNVPITANRASKPLTIPQELNACVLSCIDEIERVVKHGGLVLDDSGEIFEEYLNNLSLRGQPGAGDAFVVWVYNNQWNPEKVDRISITRENESYREFPNNPSLVGFDISDRKFIAVANAHPDKPLVLQATDIAWWEYKNTLAHCGISVCFICEDYIRQKASTRD